MNVFLLLSLYLLYFKSTDSFGVFISYFAKIVACQCKKNSKHNTNLDFV